MSVTRKRDLVGPFRVALGGLVYTFKTQRHMRFHLYVVLIVVMLGILVNLQLREMLVLLFTISLVLVAEMFNSAIEATVDLVSPNYNPMAKFAKDIAAGAVLITTIIALAVGGLLILGDNRWEQLKINLTSENPGLPFVGRMVLGGIVVFTVVVIGKGLGQRGRVLQGGLVSGHSAFAFLLATSAMFLTENALATGISFLLAALVAQSRWEAKIHSIVELCLGAAVGVITGLLIFGLLPK